MPRYDGRDNPDQNKERNLYSDRILASRNETTRYPGNLRREDLDAEFIRQEVRDKAPDFERAGKIAAIAGVTAIAGMAIGRRRMISAMDAVSRFVYGAERRGFVPASNFFNDAIINAAGGAPVSNHVARLTRRAGQHLDPELVGELEQINRKYAGAGQDAITWIHDRNRTGIDIHREFLSRKYAGHRNIDDLRALTVGDVLDNANINRRFSQNTINVLRTARNQGMVSSAMPLSRSSNFGLFRDEAGRVFDTQGFGGKRIFDAAHSVLRQFKIPFTSWRPADLIFGAIRPFAFQADHLTIGGNQLLPDGTRRTGRGLNFSLGDRIYSQMPGRARFETIASGVKVYDVSAEGSHFVARSVAIKQGRVADTMNTGLNARRATGGIASFWQRVQDVAGVGPEFSTNRSVFGMAMDAMERRAIDSGRSPGVFLANEFVPREITLSPLEKLSAHARFNRGVLPNQAAYSNIDEYLQEAVPAPQQIPFFERVKATLTGESRYGSHYRVPPSHGYPGVKVGDVPNPRTPLQGFTPVDRSAPQVVGPGGIPAVSVPATGVMDAPGTGNAVNLFLTHAVERLNQLVGTTTGFGVRPTGGSLGWIPTLAKFYGGAYAAKAGLEYLKYGDYLAGQALDFVPGLDDTTPSEYAVSAYTGAMVARQKLRESIGIQQMAAYSEKLMPGSMSLPGMVALRTLGPTAVGSVLGGLRGGVVGTAVGALIGGLDPDISSRDLEDIYSGKKKIPVMKNRGWMMGLQPYAGDEIDYYRPHWAARFKSNFRYTDVQYGSRSEYFSYESSALTPHNFFGLRKLMNPDYYAEKHYANRPYPYSNTGTEMHVGEDYIPPVSESSYAAKALGYEADPGTYTLGVNPNSASGLLRRGVDQVTQLGGIYKFAAQQLPFYNDFFGEGKGNEMYAARAGTITSTSREYYDESVGGLLGMTELLRRFMAPDYGKQGINMIPNTMPTWLPGARSEFENDRDYFNDFTLGDPYAKIPMGEARLPGRGYEALAELHSKTPGVYDAFDRYKILADVAPYSEAFKNYRTIVQSWALSGALDKSSMEEFMATEGQVRSIIDGPEFTPRIFSGVKSGTPEQLAAVNQFSAPERIIGAGWETLTHDVIPAIGRAVPIFGTIADRKLFGQRSAYESYLEDQVYGSDFHDWRSPIESMIAPRIQNLAASDPFTATVGGIGLGMGIGATPLGAAVSAAGALYTGGSSIYNTAVHGQARGGWVPDSFEERGKNEVYFDALQYEKSLKNSKLARLMGREDLAGGYQFQAGRTSVGIDYNLEDEAFINAAKFRLGSPMRKYAWQFLQAPVESRENIMAVAPEMAQPILSSAWNRQGDTRFARRPKSSSRVRSREIIDYHGMPADDWQGWSPDVPLEAIKVKTLDSVFNEASDMHRYNIWEADRRMTRRNHPGLTGAY